MSKQDYRYVNILLHGMFFMEFQRNKLVVKAPAIRMHKYCTATAGNLVEIPKQDRPHDIDMTSKSVAGLKPGPIFSFAGFPMIPQFSKACTGVGDLTNAHQVSILLEQPDEIVPLRLGHLQQFDDATSKGKVKECIMSACKKDGNTAFSLITCLRYIKVSPVGAPPTTTFSFYAEHPMIPRPDEMNHAYSEARALFSEPSKFDLQVQNPTPPSVRPVPLEPHPGYGVTPDDEMGLSELLPVSVATKAINVANCIHFAVTP